MELQTRAALCLLLVEFLSLATSERTRERMYTPIGGQSCFRRLNGTHQTGCSSAQAGSVGVLHLIQIEEDFDFLLRDLNAPPYAPIIPPHLFTRKNILRLMSAAKNISVVLLINRPDKMAQFSHELNCPNQYSGLLGANSSETITCDASSPQSMWNPWGTGLLHEDFPFPIYYIEDEEEIEKLISCFETFNNFDYPSHSQRSLCAVEVKTFMSAAVSSEVCIRRSNFLNNLARTKYCDPLEGRNVYATLFPRNSTEEAEGERKVNKEEKFIMVSCRLDTTSMFDGVGVGALDSLLSYATLVSVAHMLNQLLPRQPDKLNILFVIFNGESYDYIGSQRFVYDMEHLAFPTRSTHTTPISFENIEFMLDIGTLDSLEGIKFHAIQEFTQSQQYFQLLEKYGTSEAYDFKLNIAKEMGHHIPPTSAQSFLRTNISFPVAVLNAKPANRYYHSIYDDARNADFTYRNTTLDYTHLMEAAEGLKYYAANSVQIQVRNVSSVIALALYETLTGTSYLGTKLANPVLIDEFLFCFLESANCSLFTAASRPQSPAGLSIPPMRYISVANGPQESSGWTYRVLGYLLSKPVNVTKENCTQLPLHWFAGFKRNGECRHTTQNYSHALSPAFLIENYDWKSGQYSTWTESTWSQFSARIFLKPSITHEVSTLCIGVIVFLISFCLMYFISKRSDVLFENAASSTDALTAPTAC